MTADTAAPALAATARNVMDRIRYVVLGTVDEDGCTRTAPEYFVPHRYRDLNWVSTPTSHDSHNRERDDRLSAVPRFERDSVLRLIAAWRCFWTSSANTIRPIAGEEVSDAVARVRARDRVGEGRHLELEAGVEKALSPTGRW